MRGRVDGSTILNSGLLRHRITWQQKSVSGQDSAGQDIFTWLPVVTTQCSVTALSGRELEFANELWAEARLRIEMHYVSTIKREMRGVWGTRYLDVVDAEDPGGTRMVLQVIAKEWVQ